jgi:hypothetical protein
MKPNICMYVYIVHTFCSFSSNKTFHYVPTYLIFVSSEHNVFLCACMHVCHICKCTAERMHAWVIHWGWWENEIFACTYAGHVCMCVGMYACMYVCMYVYRPYRSACWSACSCKGSRITLPMCSHVKFMKIYSHTASSMHAIRIELSSTTPVYVCMYIWKIGSDRDCEREREGPFSAASAQVILQSDK